MDTVLKGFIKDVLNCGIDDVSTITCIEESILQEAIDTLKSENIQLDFPMLYLQCAEIALNKLNIPFNHYEIDCNYLCASIYLTKTSKRKAEQLEQWGFSVNY